MATKTVKWSGKVEEFMGKPVNPPIEYSGQTEVPADVETARGGEHWPSESGILKGIQDKLVTNDKSAEYQKTIKPLREAYEKSDDFKRKNLIESAVEAGFTQAEAEAMALQKLPIKS